MNILILTQWFDPEPNNMKALVFAKSLMQKGHRVQVLTGFPNYPTGKIYAGYRLKPYQKEVIDHVMIHRILLYPSHDANILKRMINYVSFAFFASLIGPWAVRGKIDVIYVYHPPATIMVPAILLKRIKKAGILLDINDLWPDSIASTGMLKPKWMGRIIDFWMKLCYRQADEINVLSQGMKNILISRRVAADKIRTIPVWCNESLLHDRTNQEFAKAYGLENCFLGMYAGAMGRAQHLEALIDAAKIAHRKIPEFRLLLIGHGVCAEKLKIRAGKEALHFIIFIPVISSKKLTAVLNLADVLFVHLKSDPLFEVTIPSKIAYYLAVGKPIVAGLKGDAADILNQAGEIVVSPGDTQGLAGGIYKVYQMASQNKKEMAEKGKGYYRDNLSMEAGISKFEAVLTEIAKVHKNSRKS